VTANQEISRAGVPGILDVIGIGMLGPCIIAHGSEEQKARYLGPMLHGDEVWCRLFSEPAAGSDLAAVPTRARPTDDGGWSLNGQKVSKTNAQFALAASAARSAAGQALDFAARAMIEVHGGIGATWEHDAPLFFRRAQLSRRLLGGTRDATDRVAERTLSAASA
jgi:alkylation response protein AidB-like acyl-CoA dehydrogenase